jgi:hypothetical protein
MRDYQERFRWLAAWQSRLPGLAVNRGQTVCLRITAIWVNIRYCLPQEED